MTSLRDPSMDMLLESLLNQSEDNPELIAEAELITDFTPKPRTKLFAKAESLEPSSFMLHLVYRVFEDKVEVDLSTFTTLSANNLSIVVPKLRNSKIAVLNLWGMPGLEPTDLEKILGVGGRDSPQQYVKLQDASSVRASRGVSRLGALILLGNPQIPLDFLTRYLGEYEVYHSELLRRAIRSEELRYGAPLDAKDQETLDKHQQRADSPESTVAPDCKEHAEIKAIKRLRYVIAKAHPESELQHKRCLVIDVPGYLEHVLGKDGEMLSTDAEVLSVWWKATVSAIEGNVSYYNH